MSFPDDDDKHDPTVVAGVDARFDTEDTTPLDLVVPLERPGATKDPVEANHRLVELAAMKKVIGTPTLEERVTNLERDFANLALLVKFKIFDPKEP